MSLKKRLCNPPAEEMAGCGDPEVRGMFIGAGRGAEHIADAEVRASFERDVVAVETAYIAERKRLASLTVTKMQKIFEAALEVGG